MVKFWWFIGHEEVTVFALITGRWRAFFHHGVVLAASYAVEVALASSRPLGSLR